MTHQIQEGRVPTLFLGTSFIVFVLAMVATTAGVNAQDQAGDVQTDAADNGDDGEVVVYPDGEDDSSVQRPSPARRESLKRRAGEQIGDNPRGRAMVLGMYIQEADNKRAKVVEVAPASPAFDAGIRKGDEIVSFDGFKAETYREWIDGIRRLATDATDGDTLPIALVRNNKQLNLRLRMPEARANDLPDTTLAPLGEQGLPADPAGLGAVPAGQQPGQPGGEGRTGDNNVFVGGFGGQSAGGASSGGPMEEATAEITLLNAPMRQPAAQGGRTESRRSGGQLRQQSRQPSAPETAGPGGRIGMAAFRNDQNGMMVMIDIGGMQPGNYLVGIEDPGVLSGGANAGANGRQNPRTTARGGAIGGDTPPTPVVDPSPGQPFQQRGNAPPTQQQPLNPRQPQSRNERPANFDLQTPRTVLAQIADPAQAGTAEGSPPTGAGASTTPAAGIVDPVQTPAPGQVGPTGAPPTGEVGAPNPGVDPTQNGGPSNVGGVGGGPGLQVGTLTVDQSGTGRMQQVVEGVQVQNVVGQAIVIYPQDVAQGRTLPPNLDPATDPGAGQPSAAIARGRRGASGDGTPGVGAAGARNQPVAGGGPPIQPMRPVAGGVIRLMSERQPIEDGQGPTDQTVPGQQTQAPQGEIPAASTNQGAVR